MKKGILLLLLTGSVFAHAQTLKDALFSGKLKNEPGTVIRKGDDLSTKMDSTHKVTDETANATATEPATDASADASVNKPDSAAGTSVDNTGNTTTSINATATNPDATAPKSTSPATNNAIWKTYMDSVESTLKSEVLTSKKIKHGDYYVMVSYTIDTDGQVGVSDVFLSPENSFLQQQIKERLGVDTPRLNPVLNSAGTPRKVTKKYSFTLSKQ